MSVSHGQTVGERFLSEAGLRMQRAAWHWRAGQWIPASSSRGWERFENHFGNPSWGWRPQESKGIAWPLVRGKGNREEESCNTLVGSGDVSAAKCCCSLEEKEESSEALQTHLMCELKDK